MIEIREGNVTRKYHKDMTQPTAPNSLFVFGSNTAGKHGAGSARAALQNYGAVYGEYLGPMGQSFALPTCDTAFAPLPLEVIQLYVDLLIEYATNHPDVEFFMTRTGCVRAGYTDQQIASMFLECQLTNFDYPEEWRSTLESMVRR
jgi:hypothetical protein